LLSGLSVEEEEAQVVEGQDSEEAEEERDKGELDPASVFARA